MVVAVVPVRVVQVPVHQIVLVVAVRNTLMSAIRPMHVGAALLFRRAAFGECGPRAQTVIVHMVAVSVVHVAVVKIVGVPVVLDGGVSAIRAVLMGMPLVPGAGCCWVSH